MRTNTINPPTKATKKKEETAEERMLKDIRNTKGMEAKRKVVKQFNPNHYRFGTKLDPKNPYDKQGESNE